MDHSRALDSASLYSKGFILSSRQLVNTTVDTGEGWNMQQWCLAQHANLQPLFKAEWLADFSGSNDINGLTHFLKIERRQGSWLGGGDTFSIILRGHAVTGAHIRQSPRRRWDWENGTYIWGFTIVDPATYDVDIKVTTLLCHSLPRRVLTLLVTAPISLYNS